MTDDTQHVIISREASPSDAAYHTDLECPSIEKMNDPVVREQETIDRLFTACRRCVGTPHPVGFDMHDTPDGCPSCGARLNENRKCVYCRRFDAVHDHPRNRAVP